MPGGETNALWRYQVNKRIVLSRQMLMDGFHYLVCSVRAGHSEYIRVRLFYDITLGTETAGDDHLAVFIQRFTDRIQRLFDSSVNKTTGVHYHQVSTIITGRNFITFGT